MNDNPTPNNQPVTAPGGAFHIGDTVRNCKYGYEYEGQRLLVTERGVWEARWYQLVHCPHLTGENAFDTAANTTAKSNEADWGSPGAKLAADLLPFALDDQDRLCVLLIQRDPDDDTDPYAGMWATLGGGVDPGETFAQTAVREAREEGGIAVAVDEIRLVGVFDDPDRDRRGRVISVAYTVLLPGRTSDYTITAGDDAVAYQWAPVSAAGAVNLPLAFDHDQVVAAAYRVATAGQVDPVALAMSRQEIAHRGSRITGMTVPAWFELTDTEQRAAVTEASHWLRALSVIEVR